LVDDEICGGGHLGDLRGAAGALDAQDSVPGKVGDEQRAVVESFHRDQLPRRCARVDGHAPRAAIESQDPPAVEEKDVPVGQDREVVRKVKGDGGRDGDRASCE
jgi:hypothetical protein